MKRIILIISVIMLALMPVSHAMEVVYGSALKDGAYEINVTSSSSMFRVTHCELDVTNGEMTAVMTLGGTGYEKLYMGTGEDALTADESEFIYFEENAAGEYTYTIPVEALNAETDCAAFSIRKQQWYDRTLVFEGDTLPEQAYRSNFSALWVIIPAALVCALITLLLVKRKYEKNI